jgi:cytochrome c oxidase subunit 4
MIPVKIYLIVFGGLLVLTGITTTAAFIDLGGIWNVFAALSIAVVKTLLVMLYFMHLRYSNYLIRIFAGAGIFWLGILIALTLTDYISRGWVSAFEAVLVK